MSLNFIKSNTYLLNSKHLSSLSDKERENLKKRLFDSQNGKCFICEELIDLILNKNSLQIDHVEPILAEGKNHLDNFALVHSTCNNSNQTSNLLVTKLISRFEKIKQKAKVENCDSVTLLNVLNNYDGNKFDFNLNISGETVYYKFPEVGDNIDYHSLIFTDPLGKQKSFFAKIPVEYLNQDTNINPRGIGSNLQKLVEEVFKERSQSPVVLGRVDTSGNNKKVLIFDGQDIVAVQILLGDRILPVRIFVDPDLDSLRTANYQCW